METENEYLGNPKDFFIHHDGLKNLSFDFDFSIYKKYKCRAGCEICYVKNDWLPDDKFKKHIPIMTQTRSHVEKIKDVFSFFSVVSTIDDMRYLKDTSQVHFDFYREHAEMFWLSSLTDNAIFRQLGLVCDSEMNFIGIREISISERFLLKANILKLLNVLSAFKRKSQLLLIKIILMSSDEATPKTMELIRWCEEHGVKISKQYEFGTILTEANNPLDDLRGAVSEGDTSRETYSEDGFEIFPIHNEILFLMYDSFYSELKSTIREDRSDPFETLDSFNPVSFLAKVLEDKRQTYGRYASMIEADNNYKRYFKFISEAMKINQDFNFVPIHIVSDYFRYYQELVRRGLMVETKYGLIKPGTTNIIPILEFTKHVPD